MRKIQIVIAALLIVLAIALAAKQVEQVKELKALETERVELTARLAILRVTTDELLHQNAKAAIKISAPSKFNVAGWKFVQKNYEWIIEGGME